MKIDLQKVKEDTIKEVHKLIDEYINDIDLDQASKNPISTLVGGPISCMDNLTTACEKFLIVSKNITTSDMGNNVFKTALASVIIRTYSNVLVERMEELKIFEASNE